MAGKEYIRNRLFRSLYVMCFVGILQSNDKRTIHYYGYIRYYRDPVVHQYNQQYVDFPDICVYGRISFRLQDQHKTEVLGEVFVEQCIDVRWPNDCCLQSWEHDHAHKWRSAESERISASSNWNPLCRLIKIWSLWT